MCGRSASVTLESANSHGGPSFALSGGGLEASALVASSGSFSGAWGLIGGSLASSWAAGPAASSSRPGSPLLAHRASCAGPSRGAMGAVAAAGDGSTSSGAESAGASIIAAAPHTVAAGASAAALSCATAALPSERGNGISSIADPQPAPRLQPAPTIGAAVPLAQGSSLPCTLRGANKSAGSSPRAPPPGSTAPADVSWGAEQQQQHELEQRGPEAPATQQQVWARIMQRQQQQQQQQVAAGPAPSTPGVPTDLLWEMSVMKGLDHPNVVKLHEVMYDPIDPRLVIMVMEYLPGGSLLTKAAAGPPSAAAAAPAASGRVGAGSGSSGAPSGDAGSGGAVPRLLTDPLPEPLARTYFRCGDQPKSGLQQSADKHTAIARLHDSSCGTP